MQLAQEIGSHLPFLRRFARALSGSQTSGDAYVAETLEALISDPTIFPTDLPPRHALYKIFLTLWSAANSDERPTPISVERSVAESNLETLTPLPRQAFLLRTVEGFGVEDVAAILGASPSEAIMLIDRASREIAEQVATSVLIIEDEPIIALHLEEMVRELGHEVIGVARTHKDAMNLVHTHRPGLILADIQLADGSSGLEAANEILSEIEVPIIFITAYPERLLTGEKPEPTFLITKPFQAEAVKAAISQALFFDRRASRKVSRAL
jgi:CheY-like chemotaxis protein/DNA-directed RNA polymerase specialized sigma24 family protein